MGTVVFLGMAGTAIWLALPSDKLPVTARKAESAAAPATAEPVVASAVAAPLAKPPEPKQDAVRNAEELRAQSAGTEVAKVGAAADFEPLEQGDPRWIASDGTDVRAAVKAAAALAAQGGTDRVAVNAFAEEDEAGPADEAATAAIPAIRAPRADKTDEPKQTADDTRRSRTLRAVTMRAKPSSRGSVLGTVPGRATVEVISCKSWCEIIYNGKQGFVYKGFLRNGGR